MHAEDLSTSSMFLSFAIVVISKFVLMFSLIHFYQVEMHSWLFGFSEERIVSSALDFLSSVNY